MAKIEMRALRTSEATEFTFYVTKTTNYSSFITIFLDFFDCLNRLEFFFFFLFLHIHFLQKNVVQQQSHWIVRRYFLTSRTLRTMISISSITFKAFVFLHVFYGSSWRVALRLSILTFGEVYRSRDLTKVLKHFSFCEEL